MKVWLVTWEWSGDHAKVRGKEKIAALLDSSLSAGHVREIVELLYINHECIPSERLRYANGKFNPYPAQINTLKGSPEESEIICGHNPYLRARRVEDCRVVGEGSKEKLKWEEIDGEEITG